MKASELHPCSGCGGALGVIFHVIDVDVAVLEMQGVQRRAGEELMMGSVALAEMMGSNPDVAHLASETEGEHGKEARKLSRRLLVCVNCQTTLTIYELLEKADMPQEASA